MFLTYCMTESRVFHTGTPSHWSLKNAFLPARYLNIAQLMLIIWWLIFRFDCLRKREIGHQW